MVVLAGGCSGGEGDPTDADDLSELAPDADGAGDVDARPEAEATPDADVGPDGEPDVEPDVMPDGDVEPDVAPDGDAVPDVAPHGDVEPDVAPDGDAVPDVTPDGDTMPDVGPEGDVSPDGDVPADDAPDPCGVLPPNPADVYVYGLSTTAEVGTLACPFRTILAALALPGPTGGVVRTIHVRGEAGGLEYRETGTVTVPASIVVEGDGRSSVRVTTPSPRACVGTTTCLVEVRSGGVLRRLAVRPAGATGSGDGVALTGSSAATAPPLVEDVESTGHAAAAFRSSASATLRGVRGATSRVGLLADTGTGALEVGPLSGITTIRPTFESNVTIGIHVTAGRATIRNAVASDNGDTGISLQSNPGDAFHVVEFTTAERNGLTPGSYPDGVGVLIGPTASASVTSTTMLANSAAGMIFERGGSNLLQLGCDIFADPADATRNNGHAGLCLQNSGATGSQVVQANVFSTTPACPATQRELSAEALCSALPPGYDDLVYKRGTGGGPNPMLVSTCDYCG
jgi:hypothetical protein